MIETTTNKVVYVVADNPLFAFPIPFFAPSDIHCYLYDGDNETELVRGTDFTVETQDDYSHGANVTLLGTLVPGNKLTIAREVPMTQDVNLPEYGKLPTTALEEQLDKFIMICQQLKEISARSFAVPHGMDDYDNKEIYNAFRQLVNNAETWADEARTGANNAAASANSAASSSDRASGSATAANGYATAANNSKNDAAASAENAAAAAAEIRDISNQAALNRATLLFGDWGAEGIFISYDEWTDAESLGSVDGKLERHNTSPNAHSALFDGHNTSLNAHSTLFANKAPLNSPSFTGTPKVPNLDSSDNSDKAVNSKFVHDLVGTGLIPAGAVTAYAGNGSVPSGWLLCDGRAVSRTTYSKLFSAIGTIYGAGNGSTTFNIPDFRGKFLRGYLSGTTSAIGTAQAEGLPNIKGGPIETEDNYAPTGAIYRSGTHSVCGDRDHTRNTKHFDASKSNPIYGASSHVTPVNYAVQYIIKY